MIKHYIHKVLTLSPNVIGKKAARKIKRLFYESSMHQRDNKASSYTNVFPNGKILSHFPKLSTAQLLPHAETISCVTGHYLAHHFDLLGSGWIEIRHGMRCRGLEGYRYDMGASADDTSDGQWLAGRINHANLEESMRIWELIAVGRSESKNQGATDRIYCPIDWHLDFKSGYRWQENAWYKDIQYGHKPGVDVKVPWELARMQHLPQLATAYVLAEESANATLGTNSNLKVKAKPNVLCKENGQASVPEDQKNEKTQFEGPEQYTREFRNQVLDFIANNPPRFGVNWVCTMDVAIRVANWLVAYDLFKSFGAAFDEGFERIFIRSVYEHGLHIVNNLEWCEEYRNNHYLANIAGLLFVAAYLPRTSEVDSWLAFAVRELINEVEVQFYPEGSNFEASTSYHRLSAEMVIYATAMVLGLQNEKMVALKNYDHTLIKVKPGLLPSPLPHYKLSKKNNSKSESPFPPWYFDRLEKMAEFTMQITKPNNHIPQIGDNDSGRFLKLQPVFNKMTVSQAKKRYLNLESYADIKDNAIYWDEDFLDHRHLVAAINGLFGREDFAAFAGSGKLETDMVMKLAGNTSLPSYKKINESTVAEQVRVASSDSAVHEWRRRLEAKPAKQKQIMTIPLPDGVIDNQKLYVYPDFGLYIYRSKRFYLSIHCYRGGNDGKSGHAHNDQLSIELNVDGADWITDPGTYLYTPLPERRNEYRSGKAHFIPQVMRQKSKNIATLTMSGDLKSKVICFGIHEFIGKNVVCNHPVYRRIMIKDSALILIDYFTDHNLMQYAHDKICFSPAYGKICNTISVQINHPI